MLVQIKPSRSNMRNQLDKFLKLDRRTKSMVSLCYLRRIVPSELQWTVAPLCPKCYTTATGAGLLVSSAAFRNTLPRVCRAWGYALSDEPIRSPPDLAISMYILLVVNEFLRRCSNHDPSSTVCGYHFRVYVAQRLCKISIGRGLATNPIQDMS